jgi:glycine/D-amino acid oxidase-like deaminating enzyme
MEQSVATGPVNFSTPIRFQNSLPEAVDIVIIGAGVVGVSAAIYLAEAGFSVFLSEKGRVACEQSSRNWGWIRQHGRDEAELPIMMEANRLWGELDSKTGNRTGFRREGILYLASDEKTLARREKWLEVAREHQLDTRLLSARDISGLIDQGGKDVAHKWVGATFTPSDARAEAWQAVPALAEYARDRGAAIRENCAARALIVTNGRVEGVVTEVGTLRCEQVLVSAGAWSSLFLRRHSIHIPQLSVRSTVSATEPLPEVFSGNAADEKLAFRRREDGGYNISISNFHDLYLGPDAFRNFFKWLPVAAEHWRETRLKFPPPKGFPDGWRVKRRWAEDEATPFETCRVLEPEPVMEKQEELRREFATRFPQLGAPVIKKAWAGMIDAMPDIVPIVDRVPGTEGLMIATGMSGHGFGIGPGFGKVISRMAAGKEPGHDMTRFRFSRFADGSKMRPGPAI